MVKEITDPPLSGSGRRLQDSRVYELERTLDSLREDTEVMHVLLGLSSALAEVRTEEETLEKAVRMVTEVYGADRCFAASLDNATGLFSIHAHFGFDDERIGVLEGYAQSETGLPLLRGSLISGAPVVVEDTDSDERISEEEASRRDLRAYVGIPLVRWGEDFGGLGVEFATPRRFEPKAMALARGLARQVGVALSNARRFNLLQSLRTFGLEIGSSELRLDSVMREVAAGAAGLLSADAVLVAFYDSHRNELVAAETAGLDSELGERLATLDAAMEPFATGLDGETRATDDLAFLGEDHAGFSSMVVAPIQGSQDGVLGTISLLFRRSFTLGRDEADALDVLAAQSAIAIENAQRFERQRRVARSLQEALLSIETTTIEGYTFGAVYESATSEGDVGGDFYDVFDLSEEHVGVVVGDVSGKGAEAAALTAMAKYMLRAFAIREPSPSSVLYHLNNALLQGFEQDRFATLVYALLEPGTNTLSLGVAGHPPPMVYREATGDIEDLELAGIILGVFENQQFALKTISLAPGDILLVFTDGLVEARSGDKLYGRYSVRESLDKYAREFTGEALARRIYEDATHFGEIGDDTVIFVLSRDADEPEAIDS